MIWLNSVNFIELPARHGVSYCGKSSDFSKCLLPSRTLVWREGQTFKSASLQGLGDVFELIYRKVGERVINSGIPVAFCGQGGWKVRIQEGSGEGYEITSAPCR